MSKVLVIGCGGVASVAISKCCQVSEVFTELCIASRTKSKCDALAAKLAPTTRTKITTAQVDADDVQQLCDLINSYKPDLVMNIALPYQDLTIMDACLACGVNYMDTANYEPENTDDPAWRAIYEKRCKEAGFSAYFDYSWQWAYKKKFEDAGLTALLGCGFDPGVTQAYCAYAAKHEFDSIDTIDILDCNGGDHGYAFATNFNPEINLREVSAPGSYMENGKWVEIPPMSIKREYNFDQVGQKDMYLLHHEEIESLGKNLPDVKRIRFFMTFGQSYLDHMRCLEDVGMLSTTPINYNGQEIVPIQFLKATAAPTPPSLGPRTKGKTNIGCHLHRKKGRQGQDLLHLQRLRPSGVLPGSGQSGHQLHHRCARDVRCADDADRRVDQARPSTRWRSSTPTRSSTRWTSTACPAARTMTRFSWTDGAARRTAAVCGYRRRSAAGIFRPAHALLPAG